MKDIPDIDATTPRDFERWLRGFPFDSRVSRFQTDAEREREAERKGEEEEMNELNYASLEASKRLAEAGIVLETDAIWDCSKVERFADLRYRDRSLPEKDAIPAPSMAEVWRELPHGSWIHTGSQGNEAWFDEKCFRNDNPTDALIDLLIWVLKEKAR